jgi:lia operon protein LiaG
MKRLTDLFGRVNLNRLTLIFAAVFVIASGGFAVSVLATTGFHADLNWGITLGAFDVNLRGGDANYTFREAFDNIDLRVTSMTTVIRRSPDDFAHVTLLAGNRRVRIDAEVRGNTLRVRTRPAWSIGFQLNLGKTELVIELPERHYSQISLRVTSGSIDTDGMGLESDFLNVRTTSGTVNVTGFTADGFRINATSGTVNLNGLSGSGDIRTTSGSVTVRYAQWNDSLNLRVTSGNAEIHLPSEAGIRVNSRVTSGRAEYRFGGESGRFDSVTNARFGGENVQNVDVNLTSGRVRFVRQSG